MDEVRATRRTDRPCPRTWSPCLCRPGPRCRERAPPMPPPASGRSKAARSPNLRHTTEKQNHHADNEAHPGTRDYGEDGAKKKPRRVQIPYGRVGGNGTRKVGRNSQESTNRRPYCWRDTAWQGKVTARRGKEMPGEVGLTHRLRPPGMVFWRITTP